MPLKRTADDAIAKIDRACGANLSDAERKEVSRIVEQAIIEAVAKATRRYADATKSYLGADADKAHKLSEELKQAETALVSNLKGLR